jgi:hypothetical protein
MQYTDTSTHIILCEDHAAALVAIQSAVRQGPHIFIQNIIINTGLFEMIVRVLTTCHTQYTCDSSIYIFLFNRTTLQVFVTYLTGALYVHSL